MRKILILIVAVFASLSSLYADEAELIRKGVELMELPYSQRKHLMRGRYMEEYSQTIPITGIEGYKSLTFIPFGNEHGITKWEIGLDRVVPEKDTTGGTPLIGFRPKTHRLYKYQSIVVTSEEGDTYSGQLWKMEGKSSRSFGILFCDDEETILIQDGRKTTETWILKSAKVYDQIKKILEMYESNGFFD